MPSEHLQRDETPMSTPQRNSNDNQSQSQSQSTPQRSSQSNTSTSNGIFSVPTPIKRLFDRFPLLTYPANPLPLRAPRHRDQHVLYVFITEEGARLGGPSYNPGCLKWQTYLSFCNIPVRLAASNNHCSPSGALPFLTPRSTEPPSPIIAGKLQKWAMKNCASPLEEPSDLRYEAYLSLVDHRIRRAWLYNLYLTPNFTSIAEPLYILPTSNNPFVRLSISRELRSAAEKELLKFSAVVDAETLYKEAEDAFGALEMVLGKATWFFGAEKPGLFDASVFAYTHLLLDDNLGNGWVQPRLRNAVRQCKNLVSHRNRVLTAYFPNP